MAFKRCEGPGCGKKFKPTRRWQRFHNDACRNAFHTQKKDNDPYRIFDCKCGKHFPGGRYFQVVLAADDGCQENEQGKHHWLTLHKDTFFHCACGFKVEGDCQGVGVGEKKELRDEIKS